MVKKQQLVHLHGLLAEVAEHMVEVHDTTIDTKPYDNVGVRPTDIHKSKADHKEAVMTLATCLAAAGGDHPAVEEAVAMTAGEDT